MLAAVPFDLQLPPHPPTKPPNCKPSTCPSQPSQPPWHAPRRALFRGRRGVAHPPTCKASTHSTPECVLQELLNKKDMVGDCFNQLRLARQRALNENAVVSSAAQLWAGRAGWQQLAGRRCDQSARPCTRLMRASAWLLLRGLPAIISPSPSNCHLPCQIGRIRGACLPACPPAHLFARPPAGACGAAGQPAGAHCFDGR